MRTFTLHFEADATGDARSIEFRGEDPHRAFAILAREPERRRATIWEGTKCLGSVVRTGDESWVLGPLPEPVRQQIDRLPIQSRSGADKPCYDSREPYLRSSRSRFLLVGRSGKSSPPATTPQHE